MKARRNQHGLYTPWRFMLSGNTCIPVSCTFRTGHPCCPIVRLTCRALPRRPSPTVPRPHQQDLQVWASQLLLSKGAGVGLDESQQENRFETQAAVSELLRMLRPGPGSGPAPTLCRPGEESSGSGATGEMHVQQQRQAPPQPQLHQQHMQQQHQQQVLQGQHGPGQAGRGQGAAMQGQGAHGIATLQQQAQHLQQQYQHQQQYHQQLLQQQQQQQQQQLPPGPRAGPGQHAVGAPMRAPPPPADMHSRAVVPAHGGQAAPPPPPPPQDLAPCLSAEQEWDDVREGSQGQPGPGAGVGARRAGGKAKNRGAKGADGGRGPRGKERSRYERFMDVETFWRTTTPEQRAALLKVPMAALLKGEAIGGRRAKDGVGRKGKATAGCRAYRVRSQQLVADGSCLPGGACLIVVDWHVYSHVACKQRNAVTLRPPGALRSFVEVSC